jgi:xanthine dehydrogenase accessory factor
MDIFEELVRLRRLGQRCALATIVEAQGSVPSCESAKLLVREDGSMVGTVGGGCIEAEVFNTAREVLHTGKPRRLKFDLSQDAAYENGLICGGQLEIFVEPILPQPRAFIFGAGHISKSLSKVAAWAGFATVVVDDRESFANRERFPEADEVLAGEYEALFPRLAVNESSFVVIVTRGHRDDLRVLRWAARTPARYVAMIGSKRKVIAVLRQLEEEGTPREALARVHAPMGLDIGAVTPEEIAVSTVAEMIAVRRNAASNWREISKAISGSERSRALVSPPRGAPTGS